MKKKNNFFVIKFNIYFTARIGIKPIIDVISGKKILVSDSLFANAILNFRMLAQEELRDDLLIGLKLDHSYPVKIVNKKNSQHKYY